VCVCSLALIECETPGLIHARPRTLPAVANSCVRYVPADAAWLWTCCHAAVRTGCAAVLHGATHITSRIVQPQGEAGQSLCCWFNAPRVAVPAATGAASTLKYQVPVAGNPGHPLFYPKNAADNETTFSVNPLDGSSFIHYALPLQ